MGESFLKGNEVDSFIPLILYFLVNVMQAFVLADPHHLVHDMTMQIV